MFATFRTLMTGASARAEERVRDVYSIELIDQKIRESGQALKAAKLSLASLIQRERAETRQLEQLQSRAKDLMERAAQAMDEGREDLAREAAQAVADMENEAEIRRETLRRLETRILQLRQSLEAMDRRITDLKQGAIAARAVRREQEMQKRLGRHLGGDDAATEAEELIARVLNRDDPFEQGQILAEIDRGLERSDIADRMAEAGFGSASKTSASDVLARLKAEK